MSQHRAKKSPPHRRAWAGKMNHRSILAVFGRLATIQDLFFMPGYGEEREEKISRKIKKVAV
jgi:hypothetical protein